MTWILILMLGQHPLVIEYSDGTKCHQVEREWKEMGVPSQMMQCLPLKYGEIKNER